MKLIKKLRTYTLLSFLCAWIFLWVRWNITNLSPEIHYYKQAVFAPYENLRATHSIFDRGSKDYYEILKICDQILPPLEEIQLILPKEPNQKFEFLREKGRYILYPRNYGDNETPRDYILVYGKEDYKIPQGYEVIKAFDHHKYLLGKQSEGK